MVARKGTLGVERLFGLTPNPAVTHIGLQIGRGLPPVVMPRDGPFTPAQLTPAA